MVCVGVCVCVWVGVCVCVWALPVMSQLPVALLRSQCAALPGKSSWPTSGQVCVCVCRAVGRASLAGVTSGSDQVNPAIILSPPPYTHTQTRYGLDLFPVRRCPEAEPVERRTEGLRIVCPGSARQGAHVSLEARTQASALGKGAVTVGEALPLNPACR